MVKDMQIQEIEEGIVEVKTTIDRQVVSDTHSKSLQKVRQKASVKGFRKGMAPVHLVQNIYKSEIRYETVNDLFPRVYDTMIKEHDIKPLSTPEISDLNEFSPNEDLTLTLKVEIAPYVKTLGELTDVHTKKIVYNYDESTLMEKELESLAQVHAKYEDIQNGIIQMGDFVHVRYSIDSPDFQRGETTHYVLVKQNDPQFEFTSHIIGKSLGQTYTQEITFSAFYKDPELAEKTVQVTFTPLDGKTVVSPPIDDELAKKFHFDTLDALKEEISKILAVRAKMKGVFDTTDLIYTELARLSSFSIGEKVVLNQTQHQLQKKLQDIMKMGTFEQYTKEKGFNDEGFIEEVRSEARESIQKFLVERELLKKFQIEASDEELESFITQVAEQEIPNRQEIVKFYQQNKEKKDNLRDQLLSQKLGMHLLETQKFDGIEERSMEYQSLL